MDINLTIPQDWNELTQTQLENICSTLHFHQVLIENKHDEDEVNAATYLSIAKELLRNNSYKAVKVALREVMPKAFVEHVDFIFGQPCNRYQFPEEVMDGFTGPSFRLGNITIAELSYADAWYYRWTQKKTQEYLNLLCATLYRPISKEVDESSIDNRIPFNKAKVNNTVHLFEKVPFETKLAIAKAYEGTRNYIADRHPFVFPKAPKTEEQPNTKNQKPPTKKYVPFGELIANKIEFDPSKLEAVEQMNAFKFLGLYEAELRENRKKPKK